MTHARTARLWTSHSHGTPPNTVNEYLNPRRFESLTLSETLSRSVGMVAVAGASPLYPKVRGIFGLAEVVGWVAGWFAQPFVAAGCSFAGSLLAVAVAACAGGVRHVVSSSECDGDDVVDFGCVDRTAW
jgi:hypothetical protein